jgi:alpha-L-fucosidase
MPKLARGSLLFAASALLSLTLLAAEDVTAPYVPSQDPLVQQKLAWWQDQKFGLFMHWGPYSQWGVVESWSLCPEDEGWTKRRGVYGSDYFAYKAAYERLGHTFNPVAFDPAKWARAAKDAGMRYVVFTTKHHDGFCMFDTATTSYKVTDPSCPFSRSPKANVTREVFQAFRAEGFGIGAYFSKPDWHSEHYWWPYFPPKDRHANYDLARYPERWKGFVAYTHRQIEELVTGYGPMDILWLDGGWVAPPREDIDMASLAAMARRHQPGLLVVDRSVHGPFEDYRTPEQSVPDRPLPYPWETCMTMGKSWSFVPGDSYKDARTLIHLLSRIVSRGGNFLLNIGPGPDGDFDPAAYEQLRAVGAWMRVNGEAIYGTRAVAPHAHGSAVFTRKPDGTVYALVLQEEGRPAPETVELPAVLLPAGARVDLLGGPDRLRLARARDVVQVRLDRALQARVAGQAAFVLRITVSREATDLPRWGPAAPPRCCWGPGVWR